MRHPIPRTVRSGTATVTVERAWPSVRVEIDGARVVRFEGVDRSGRLRAGRLAVRTTPTWEVLRVHLTPPGRDRKLPDLAPAAREGRVVVHRLGRRAVVSTRDRYVKIVRPGLAVHIAQAQAAGHRIAASAGFDAPSVLAYTTGRIDLSVLTGRTMHDAGRDASSRRWNRWWTAWAERWPNLVRARHAGLPLHGPEQEVAGLRRWVDHLRVLGVLGPWFESLEDDAEIAAAALLRERTPCDAVSHRDLHDKQLLCGSERLGLLDFDTLARAEPALDLANLAVHIRLRTAQGLWSPWHRDRALAAVGEVAATLSVPPGRLAAYVDTTRLRLACVYAMRPRWRRLCLALLMGLPAGGVGPPGRRTSDV